jgi:hypothetical protein
MGGCSEHGARISVTQCGICLVELVPPVLKLLSGNEDDLLEVGGIDSAQSF